MHREGEGSRSSYDQRQRFRCVVHRDEILMGVAHSYVVLMHLSM